MQTEFTLKETIKMFQACDSSAVRCAAAHDYESAKVYASLADSHARIIAAFISQDRTTVIYLPDN